jgi:hypothetical protein
MFCVEYRSYVKYVMADPVHPKFKLIIFFLCEGSNTEQMEDYFIIYICHFRNRSHSANVNIDENNGRLAV